MHSKNLAEPFRAIVNAFAPHVPPEKHMKQVFVDAELLKAAAEFLTKGASLHQVGVSGKMMDRADVALALMLKADPAPRGEYREMLDASDVRDL